jgi:hypothetical protein
MSNLKIQGNANGAGTTTLQSGNTASSVTFSLPIADGTNGQALITDGSGVLSFSGVGTDASLITSGTLAVARGGSGAATLTGVLKGNGTSAFTAATAGTDYVAPSGALGTPSSGTLTNCTADGTNAVGYRNVPQSGSDKTTSYTLTTGDVGKFIGVGTSGSITIPNSTFAAGDIVSIFNNTSGGITITCTITTAYIAGTNTDVASVTLATRGVATLLFISGTVVTITGNVA